MQVRVLGGIVLVFFSAALAASDPGQTNDAAEAMKNLKLCQESLGKDDVDAAVEYGEKAVKLDGGNWECQLWLGHAYGRKAQKASVFSKLSNAKKCKAAYEKAVELKADSAEARQALMEYLLQAPGIAGGDKNKAREQATEILKLDAVRGHLAFAQVYLSENDAAKAEQEYIAITELDPNNQAHRNNLGLFYVNQGKYDQARNIFLTLNEAAPQETAYIYQLGKIALLSGKDLDKGLEYFQEYLKVEPKPDYPTWADAHWRMGLIQEKLGSKDKAVAEYQKALELNPQHKFAKESLSKIRGGDVPL
jgi:tetratricopeptide (TPR) repeat protein